MSCKPVSLDLDACAERFVSIPTQQSGLPIFFPSQRAGNAESQLARSGAEPSRTEKGPQILIVSRKRESGRACRVGGWGGGGVGGGVGGGGGGGGGGLSPSHSCTRRKTLTGSLHTAAAVLSALSMFSSFVAALAETLQTCVETGWSWSALLETNRAGRPAIILYGSPARCLRIQNK